MLFTVAVVSVVTRAVGVVAAADQLPVVVVIRGGDAMHTLPLPGPAVSTQTPTSIASLRRIHRKYRANLSFTYHTLLYQNRHHHSTNTPTKAKGARDAEEEEEEALHLRLGIATKSNVFCT